MRHVVVELQPVDIVVQVVNKLPVPFVIRVLLVGLPLRVEHLEVFDHPPPLRAFLLTLVVVYYDNGQFVAFMHFGQQVSATHPFESIEVGCLEGCAVLTAHHLG